MPNKPQEAGTAPTGDPTVPGHSRHVVPPEAAGQRLDVWLESRIPELSRSRIQGLIRNQQVTRDGHAVKPHQKVTTGMTVEVLIPPTRPANLAAEAIPLNVLYEDTHMIVINKPAGRVVHPAAGHASGTLVNALLHHCPDIEGIGGERRPGIVHRLDKDTSGVLVVAKNDHAMLEIQAQFKDRRVHKVYLAVVRGVPVKPEGRIEKNIARSTHDRKKMAVSATAGRLAVTRYRVVEALGSASLVRVVIETGRTHQIRVHMAHIGHPVAGDRVYGRKQAPLEAPRQMLHAAELTLDHPADHRRMTFTAPLPDDMSALLERLRGGQ